MFAYMYKRTLAAVCKVSQDKQHNITSSSASVPLFAALGAILAVLTTIELMMPLALTPNLREERVSPALSREGEQQMMRAVLAVPPSESYSNPTL